MLITRLGSWNFIHYSNSCSCQRKKIHTRQVGRISTISCYPRLKKMCSLVASEQKSKIRTNGNQYQQHEKIASKNLTLIAWACALIFLNVFCLSSAFFKSRVYLNRREAFSTRAACCKQIPVSSSLQKISNITINIELNLMHFHSSKKEKSRKDSTSNNNCYR